MSIYIILAIFSAILILFDDFTQNNKKVKISKVLFSIIILLLFIVSALRQPSVGQDTKVYIHYFNIIKSNSLIYSINKLSSLENGYIIINKILSFFTLNEQGITILNSLLLILTLSFFTKKESKNILMTIFLFITLGFYQTSFNIVRACYATFMGYIAINKIEKNKAKGLLLFVLAFLLHQSTIVLLLIPLLNKIKLKKKNIKYYLALIILLFISMDYILPLISMILPNQYDGYLHTTENGILDKVLLLVVHVGLYIFSLISIKNKDDYVKENKKYIIFMLLEILFYLFSIKYVIFTRVAYIFSMYTIVSIPNIIEKIENNNVKQITKFIVIILCLIQFILRLQINNIGSTIPYRTIFF